MSKKRLILWILVILTVFSIFGQSMLDQTVSNKESNAVQQQIVDPINNAIRSVGATHLYIFNIRKIAHIIEFLVLGLELFFLFQERKIFLRGAKSISWCGFFALVDESIQYFTGRTSLVIDVWDDILGAVIGSLIGIILVFMINKAKTKG